MRLALRTVCMVGVALMIGADPAAASASSVEAGWWTSAPVLVAPDVGDNLLVQGAPSGDEPLAYAGVEAILGPDEEATSLTIAVAEGSASTPGTVLAACPLTEPLPATESGTAEGPAFDCASKAEAEPSDDGTSYRFELTVLGQGGTVAVAIVPTSASDRVVLVPPEPEAIETSGGGGDSDRGGDEIATSTFDEPVDSGGTASFSTPETFEVPITPAPSPIEPAAEPVDVPAPPAEESQALAASPVSTTDSDSSRLPALAFAGLALVAVTLWRFAGTPTPQDEPSATPT